MRIFLCNFAVDFGIETTKVRQITPIVSSIMR